MHRYFFAISTSSHVGGDDFFIGVTGSTVEDLGKTRGSAARRFPRQCVALYSEEDRAAGRMKGMTAGRRDLLSADALLDRCTGIAKGLVIDDITASAPPSPLSRRRPRRVAAAWSSIRSAMLASRDQLPPFSLAPSIVLRAELCPCLRGGRPRVEESLMSLPTDMLIGASVFRCSEAMTIARGRFPF